MQVAECTAKNTTSTEADTAVVVQALQAENASLKQQLNQARQQPDWFKRRLFGRKSEKRITENPDKLDLRALLGDAPPPAGPEPTEQITYRRRKRGKRRGGDDVTDSVLCFGPDVPIGVIELTAPQLEGPEADQYEVIDYKISRRLAEVPAPSAVFEGSLADVSLLAGLLVDKFCYHLPLYRQHQRLKDAGITWYWPIHGEDDEICFTWSAGRGRPAATAGRQ